MYDDFIQRKAITILRSNGNVGIDNENPYYKLGVNGTIYGENIITGSVDNVSDGSIEIGKNNGSGGNRKMKLHYNSGFDMCISDVGNNSSTTTTTPFRIGYSAPTDSLYIDGYGRKNLKHTSPSTVSVYGRKYNRWTNNQLTTHNFYYSMRQYGGTFWLDGGSIVAGSSSYKIKKEITDINDDTALKQVLALKPKTYKYIDDRKHELANKTVYGYISEEVKEVFPEATRITETHIPNIYKNIQVINKTQINSDIALEVGIEYKAYITYYESDNEEDETGKDEEILIRIVSDDGNNLYTIDKEINKDEIFLYGKLDKFPLLNKDYFHALHTSAIQELNRKIVSQQEQITQLLEILTRNGIN